MLRNTSRGWLRRFSPISGSCRFVSYKLSSISNLESLKVSGDDLKGLFSNKSVDELWFQRGQKLVDELNVSLEENQMKDLPTNLDELIALTINKPELVGVNSYASLLYNLQFFLEGLKSNGSEAASSWVNKPEAEDLLRTPKFDFTNKPTEESLVSWIDDSFGSMQEFRTLLLNSSKGIKGDGYTWVVAESSMGESALKDSTGNFNKTPLYDNLAVVNTYNAGTVDDTLRSGQLSKLKQQKEAKLEAMKKKQEERNKINNPESSSEVELDEFEDSQESSSDNIFLGTVEEAEAKSLFSDKKLIPILAIDSSPRSYLLDYGVFGKQRYLDNVWECIDWDVVAKRMPPRSKQFVKLD